MSINEGVLIYQNAFRDLDEIVSSYPILYDTTCSKVLCDDFRIIKIP